MMEPEGRYRIGEIANQAGVSVESLRYYEKRGLLNAPARTGGGYRMYSGSAVLQVRFIKQAQSLGLTLEDIQQLVRGQQYRSRSPSCRKVRDLLTGRIDDIDARIKELREFRRTLHTHLVACDEALTGAPEPPCPTIAALDRPTRVSEGRDPRAAGSSRAPRSRPAQVRSPGDLRSAGAAPRGPRGGRS